MKRKHAYEAIKAILAAIDDSEIPAPDKLKSEDGRVVAWFGGMGYYLGSAKRNGALEPMIHRDNAATKAIIGEAVYRLDKAHSEAIK